MRWGFGWELGPFETADAIGIQRVLDATREVNPELLDAGVPPIWQEVLSAGRNRLRDGEAPPAAADLQILRSAKERSRCREEECGREPGRPRRRRAVRRVPFEDERHRRRHDPDAAGGRPRSGAELRRARRRQRRPALLRRRQPDAGAARGAGRELGRDRPDDPRVPAGDDGAALLRTCRSSWRRPAWRSAAAARSRCTPIACRRPRKPTWVWSKSASA